MSFTLLAFLAAALYALNAPLSKLLLQDVSPAMMAAFLYLGAGIGMLAIGLIRSCVRRQPFRLHFTRKDAPYVAGMTALDVAAPILLMLGLTMTSSASASLLNNFEIVATTLIAMLLFREKISKRLWLAIGLITLSGVLLSLDEGGTPAFFFRFSAGFAGLRLLGTGKQLHPDALPRRSAGGRGGQGDRLRLRLAGNRPLRRRTAAVFHRHAADPAAGLRGLWAEHLLLRLRPAGIGGGQNQRLLCRGSVYQRVSVAAYFPGNPEPAVQRRLFNDGRRDVAGRAGEVKQVDND